METLAETLRISHDWAVDRIHFLCDRNQDANAYAIQCEFSEWMDPTPLEVDVFSMSYIQDEID